MLAAETDHFAAAAIAALNHVTIAARTTDLLDTIDRRWEVVTASDVCYESPVADRVTGWLRGLAAGEPSSCCAIRDAHTSHVKASSSARYLMPTSRDLEDRETRDTVVWEVIGD